MNSDNFKWHFPSTDNGDEDGINDSLREPFEGDHERYVARESIQNSLDARRDNQKPVKVRFERIDIPVEYIPGIHELENIFRRAKEYSHNQEKSDLFYSGALKMLQSQTIPVLKVSDYNTTGLNGDDQDTSGGWYKLIRATGVNSMNGVGGGSFGIGKGAPFAASGLRTVFYSTINERGENAFQGKSRLSSYRDEYDDVRRGVGQFGLRSFRGVVSIRNRDEIPDLFRRTEQGTDFYIIGYQTEQDDWTRLLLNSLLNNFWMAIQSDELDVELAENGTLLHAISEENLDEFMAEYASGKNDSYNFYRAVVEPTKKIEAILPMLKDVELYVKTGENYPKTVQLMRQAKMVVSKIDNYRVLPEPYVAVFICKSDVGNKLLRDLEPPAHDKWDPDRNKQYGKKVHSELLGWIRAMLKEMAEDKDVAPEDIPGLNQWLPDSEERDDMNPYLGSAGEHTKDVSNKETSTEIGATQENKLAETVVIRNREVTLTKGFAPGSESGNHHGSKQTLDDSNPPKVDYEESGNVPRINPANIRFRAREINRNGTRIYQTVVTATAREVGALRIMAVGDDSNYPVEISKVEDSNGASVNFRGSFIKDLALEPDLPVKLFITLTQQRRYALGVE